MGAGELARRAAALAAGARVDLPDDLVLWRLAGGRPAAVVPESAADPAGELGATLEATLSARQRRQGAHYTPARLAGEVASLALSGMGEDAVVVDPACGGGALLLGAGRDLVGTRARREEVARHQLWGADIDPLAAAVAEAAIALWSGGVAPAPGQVVGGDTLRAGAGVWAAPPVVGFDVVVANPPFQGQLARDTARSAADTRALRERFGAVVPPYVDTAALFLLVAVELLRPGGKAAVIQPQSVCASRDAGAVRTELAARAGLQAIVVPNHRAFVANVRVCVPVLVAGEGGVERSWSRSLASGLGTPHVDPPGERTVGSVASVVAGFRDEYYGLVPHVREAGAAAVAPLVTSGVVDLGRSAWGDRPIRFAKRRWDRPEVDLAGVAEAGGRVASWIERVRRPKVVVASQTRVIEAVADHAGTWVPATPLVVVLPEASGQLDRLAAALCSPVASAGAMLRMAGSALSGSAIRVTAGVVSDVPLPVDDAAWDRASRLLAEGDLAAFAEAATAMHRLPADQHDAVLEWWSGRTETDLASG